MSKPAKHIKITKPTGEISFALHNDTLYKALTRQNNRIGDGRKHKIEIIEISEEDIQAQSGFDDKAGLATNPAAANLLAINASQDKRIAELEAALEASFEETKKAKSEAKGGKKGKGNESGDDASNAGAGE